MPPHHDQCRELSDLAGREVCRCGVRLPKIAGGHANDLQRRNDPACQGSTKRRPTNGQNATRSNRAERFGDELGRVNLNQR